MCSGGRGQWLWLYIRKERKPLPDGEAVARTQAGAAHRVMPKAIKGAWLTAQLSQVLGARAEASDPVQQEGKMREPFEALWPMPGLPI